MWAIQRQDRVGNKNRNGDLRRIGVTCFPVNQRSDVVLAQLKVST